ncbi:multicopper oxidase domain-containing protein [Methylacidiphilum caldifontis]|nr:multicopper oxidase domain-containing protein [Methylacidiphilum caldifontis]
MMILKLKLHKFFWSSSTSFFLFIILCIFLGLKNLLLSESRNFELTIEDTIITLVKDQKFHTFAFNGQVPGPLIHVKYGDDVTVKVTNLTTLPHTIHWHGILQTGTWQMDGVPNTTQPEIKPGDTFSYHFKALPAGTYWYHCHVNVNEHVSMRGMWGPLIVDPPKPHPLEKKVTKDYILMLSSWPSQWARKPGYGGIPGDVEDYFTINAKSYPETQPIRVKKGDFIRLRIFATSDTVHSLHIHGHVFLIGCKDGHFLPNPIEADTLLISPGERYDLFMYADNPGRWMVHDHVDVHTTNGGNPMGGIMTVIEYDEVEKTDSWYDWKDKKFVPDFFYEESLKKPYGLFINPAFKGEPAPQ